MATGLLGVFRWGRKVLSIQCLGLRACLGLVEVWNVGFSMQGMTRCIQNVRGFGVNVQVFCTSPCRTPSPDHLTPEAL